MGFPSKISVSGIFCPISAGMVIRISRILSKSTPPLTRGLDSRVSVRYTALRNSSAFAMPMAASLLGVSSACPYNSWMRLIFSCLCFSYSSSSSTSHPSSSIRPLWPLAGEATPSLTSSRRPSISRYSINPPSGTQSPEGVICRRISPGFCHTPFMLTVDGISTDSASEGGMSRFCVAACKLVRISVCAARACRAEGADIWMSGCWFASKIIGACTSPALKRSGETVACFSGSFLKGAEDAPSGAYAGKSSSCIVSSDSSSRSDSCLSRMRRLLRARRESTISVNCAAESSSSAMAGFRSNESMLGASLCSSSSSVCGSFISVSARIYARSGR